MPAGAFDFGETTGKLLLLCMIFAFNQVLFLDKTLSCELFDTNYYLFLVNVLRFLVYPGQRAGDVYENGYFSGLLFIIDIICKLLFVALPTSFLISKNFSELGMVFHPFMMLY